MALTATPVAGPAGDRHPLRHAAFVCAGFILLCSWLFAPALISGRLLSESDLFDSYLPLFQSPSLVWSSFEFGGIPAFADPENSAFYPVRMLFAQAFHWWNGFIVSAYVLAGCFTYAYLSARTRSRVAATFGAVAFVLSEAMIERVPHTNITHTVVWVPLILLAVDRMRETPAWGRWAAVAAFAGASCVLAGHPQFAVYSAYLCGAYAVTGLIVERAAVVHWLRLAGTAVTVLLLSAVSLVPLVELSRHSVRQTLDFSNFVDYANTRWQMLAAFVPNISHHGLEAPTYVGLAVVLCALIGVAQLRSNWRVGFWIVVAVVGLLLGAGSDTPLAQVVYRLPLYDRFRIVSRHLVFAALAIDILAAYGVAAVLTRRVSKHALLCTAGVFGAALAAAVWLLARHPEAVQFDRAQAAMLPWVVDGAWIQVTVATLAVACVGFMWRFPALRALPMLLVALVAVDLLRSSSYDWSWRGLAMVTVAPGQLRPGAEALALARGLEPAKQRFLSVPDSLRDEVVPGVFARTWSIPTFGGYTSLLLQGAATLGELSANGRVDRAMFTDDDRGLDVAAVKYLVVRQDLVDPVLFDSPRWRRVREFTVPRRADDSERQASGADREYALVENTRALSRAWLATEVLPVTDGAMFDAIHASRLRDGRRFDPGATALVLEGAAAAAQYPEGGSADVVTVADSHIVVNVTSPSGGFLVLSEAYYPGWTARIDDGPSQPVLSTDIALQGITVPPGRHAVTFTFQSRSREAGLALGGVGALALAATAFLGWRPARS